MNDTKLKYKVTLADKVLLENASKESLDIFLGSLNEDVRKTVIVSAFTDDGKQLLHS